MTDYKKRIESQIKKREAEKALYKAAGNITGVTVSELLIVELKELLL